MAFDFRELVIVSLNRQGQRGLLLLWLRTLVDLATSASHLHSEELEMKRFLKTSPWGIGSVCVAAIVCNTILAALALALFGVRMLLVDGGGYQDSTAALELILFGVPPLLTGLVLARVRPFYRPMVTAPIGVAALWGLIGLLDERVSPLGLVGILVATSSLVVVGSLLARIKRRPTVIAAAA
jgi:hypothetical protein